ncbi:hypothetical protein LJC61_08420 [Ruminococcaceae bacterium OttesenSCG-928-A16]|nr:hypothetical protein [Ruminococcaceae bacterium OttesenSCG-928-A16]
MLKEIKRHFYINRKDYATSLMLAIGIALLADLIVMIVLQFQPGAFMPPISSILFVAGSALYGLIFAMGAIGGQFNMAIKMGAVRWQYVLVFALLNITQTFVLIMLGNAWQFVNKGLLQIAGGQPMFTFTLSPLWAIALAILVTLFGLWIGALLMRYGKAAFWVLWAFWVFSGAGSGAIANAITEPGRTDIFARIVKSIAAFVTVLPVSALWLGGVLLMAAIAGHAWFILRKIPAQD